MGKKISAVISCYLPRGHEKAIALALALKNLVSEVVLVINSDSVSDLKTEVYKDFLIAIRPNLGMNIGAWGCGLNLINPKHSAICLQDECEIVDKGFPAKYQSLFDDEKVGMVGESLNPKWDLRWQQLSESALNYRVHHPEHGEISRVDLYLRLMKTWGVTVGPTGRHLRALVWGFNANICQHLRELPCGRTKEECIAAEIAVSHLVQNNLGREVVQSGRRHFSYLSHPEWAPDGWAKSSTRKVY